MTFLCFCFRPSKRCNRRCHSTMLHVTNFISSYVFWFPVITRTYFNSSFLVASCPQCFYFHWALLYIFIWDYCASIPAKPAGRWYYRKEHSRTLKKINCTVCHQSYWYRYFLSILFSKVEITQKKLIQPSTFFHNVRYKNGNLEGQEKLAAVARENQEGSLGTASHQMQPFPEWTRSILLKCWRI